MQNKVNKKGKTTHAVVLHNQSLQKSTLWKPFSEWNIQTQDPMFFLMHFSII